MTKKEERVRTFRMMDTVSMLFIHYKGGCMEGNVWPGEICLWNDETRYPERRIEVDKLSEKEQAKHRDRQRYLSRKSEAKEK